MTQTGLRFHQRLTCLAASCIHVFSFDTVVCLNVLEHVKDDLRALSFMRTVLEPGGRLVLQVPAFQFLYGSVDRAIGHYRRYTRRDLALKMRQAGFEVEDSFYMNVIGMAGWFWNNRIMKIDEENPASTAISKPTLKSVGTDAGRMACLRKSTA